MSPAYVIRKIGISLLTALVSLVVVFFVLRLMPGDIIEVRSREMAEQMGIDLLEARNRVVMRYNFDPYEPLHQQLARFARALSRGDLGTSMFNPLLTVNTILATVLPWTLFVVTIATVLSFLFGIFFGALMAVRKGVVNFIITFYVTIISTTPAYIIAILLSIFLVFRAGLFPTGGVYSIHVDPGLNIAFLGSVLWHAALPIFTFVLTTTGGWILQMKGASISTLGEDYVFAARARGIPERIIRSRYMKKNAMIPLVTTLAMAFGGMIGGAPLVEGQLRYMGMGVQMAQAIGQRDYVLYQGLLICVSLSVIAANLIADLLYAKLDPRIRLE